MKKYSSDNMSKSAGSEFVDEIFAQKFKLATKNNRFYLFIFRSQSTGRNVASECKSTIVDSLEPFVKTSDATTKHIHAQWNHHPRRAERVAKNQSQRIGE